MEKVMKKRGWSKSGIVFLLSISLLLFSSFKAEADEAKYVYDDLGRLYQVIDQQGNVATYNYDAVGNLLSIIRSTGGLPVPEITGISPNLANPGDTVQVTISGNHFLNTAVSTDNPGINISNLQIADTSITATFNISFFSPIGLTTVTVANALGSANIGFTVNPQPIINYLSPSYGPVSRRVTISGTGFSAVPSENLVLFNGVSAPIYSCTPFSILTSVPTGATSGAVTVTTKGIVSNWKGFTVISAGPPPLIDSIIPNVGSEEGGDTVTISGSGFTSDTRVYISEKPVASVTLIDASTLRIVTAPGAVGSWNVLVTNQSGDAVLPGGFTFISGPPQGIVSVNPATGQTNIPTNTLITVLFARPVDRMTVSSSTFSVVKTGTAIQVSGLFSFGFDDRILTFRPTVALKPDTSYTISATIGIKSSDGIQLNQPFNSSFTTAGFSDNASPTITMSPNSGATGVPINTLIVLIFSEPINPTSINSSTFVVTNDGMPVSGNTAFSNQNMVLAFAPFPNLLPSSFVNVALSPGITDVAGNPIVGNGGVGTYFVGSFTTADTFDTVAPSIAVDPPDNATGIDTNTSVSVTVTFSEPINPSTLSPGTFTVSVEGSQCPGRISLSGLNTKATFIPDQPFPYLSLVTVRVAAGISDVAGNTTTTSFTSTFTTEPESILTLTYSGPTTLAIGETISVDVANTGDKDTSLTYEVSLSGRGTVIYQTSLTDAIAAGATKSYALQIPAHVASGDYTLHAEVTNNKGKKTTEDSAAKPPIFRIIGRLGNKKSFVFNNFQ
jgi:YD repeat-containing protein